jgi:hypothetical protein
MNAYLAQCLKRQHAVTNQVLIKLDRTRLYNTNEIDQVISHRERARADSAGLTDSPQSDAALTSSELLPPGT